MSNSGREEPFSFLFFLSHLLWGEGWMQRVQRLRSQGPPLVQSCLPGLASTLPSLAKAEPAGARLTELLGCVC